MISRSSARARVGFGTGTVAVAVLGVQPGGDLGQDQVLGGLAGLGVLGQHPPGHVQPARHPPRPAGRCGAACAGRPALRGRPPRTARSSGAPSSPTTPSSAALAWHRCQLRRPGSVLRPRLPGQRQRLAAALVVRSAPPARGRPAAAALPSPAGASPLVPGPAAAGSAGTVSSRRVAGSASRWLMLACRRPPRASRSTTAVAVISATSHSPPSKHSRVPAAMMPPGDAVHAVTSSALPASRRPCRSVASRCCHSSRSTAALTSPGLRSTGHPADHAADRVAGPDRGENVVQQRHRAGGRAAGSRPGTAGSPAAPGRPRSRSRSPSHGPRTAAPARPAPRRSAGPPAWRRA